MRYIGPFIIPKDLGQGAFQISDYEGNAMDKSINGFILKPFHQRKKEVGINIFLACERNCATMVWNKLLKLWVSIFKGI